MTIERIDAVTGEVVEAISETEARRLTTEARSEFRSAAAHHERGWQIVAEAIKAGGHAALGYRSASEYLEREFAEVLSGLDVDARRVAVRELSALGMSTRAIAPVVGTDYSTVSRDRQVLRDATPEPAEVINPTTGEVESLDELTVPRVIGRDGKTYTRPEPSVQRRPPLPPEAQRAAERMFDAAERLQLVMSDDRLPQNREQVAALTRAYLSRTVEVCQDLLDRISPTNNGGTLS